MPLTLVHPVAALPLRRLGLPVSALVIGSMTPDVEYMLRMMPVSCVSHTAWGLVIFCVPVGLLALWLLARVWRAPVLSLLGFDREGGRGRCGVTASALQSAGGLAVLCLALLAGAVTHVLWDSFTHSYGRMVERYDVLAIPFAGTRGGGIPLYRVLQHASTVLGFLILALMAVRRRDRIPPIPRRAWRVAGTVLGASAVAGLAYGVMQAGPLVDFRAAQRMAGFGAVGFFTFATMAGTALSLGWHIWLKRFGPPPVYMSGGLKE